MGPDGGRRARRTPPDGRSRLLDLRRRPGTPPGALRVRAPWPARPPLAGEADLSNRDAVAAVLHHLLEDTRAGPMVLDVTELAYADATACRLIIETARRAGGRLRAVGARPPLHRLLSLEGAASVPGLLSDR